MKMQIFLLLDFFRADFFNIFNSKSSLGPFFKWIVDANSQAPMCAIGRAMCRGAHFTKGWRYYFQRASLAVSKASEAGSAEEVQDEA